ncbi:MAG: response regulator [Gemmatales bacterium]
MNSAADQSHGMKTPSSSEPLVGDLLRNIKVVRQDLDNALNDNGELIFLLEQSRSGMVAYRRSWRAMLNLMEDAVEARNKVEAVNESLNQSKKELETRVRDRTAELTSALAELKREAAERIELTRKLVSVQEDERSRTARDLHDQTSQLLAGLSLVLKSVMGEGNLSETSMQKLLYVKSITDELARQVHSLAVRLRPTALDDFGWRPALDQLISEWKPHVGFHIDFQTIGHVPERFSRETDTVIYRVVQEALTNIAKHAHAKQVNVIMSANEQEVKVCIEDDGIGFDRSMTSPSNLGLKGMHERVLLAGGNLEINSQSGMGSAVIAILPLNERVDHNAKSPTVPVDDHPVMRSGLRLLLDTQSDMEVVGDTDNGKEAVQQVADTSPDVVIMDVSLPGLNGIDATKNIHQASPAIKILALTAYEDRGYYQQMRKAGASGFVLKRSAADDLVDAVRQVARGETYVDPALFQSEQHLRDSTETTELLSKRELEVLKRIALGEAVKNVAVALELGMRTVETYKARAMEKLGLNNRADLIRFAQQNGWFSQS